MRRSLLFLPGNQPSILQNGTVLPADALIFDLEDAVAADEKDSARNLVASALRHLDFGRREKIVRINDDSALRDKDIRAVVLAGAETIMPPKVTGSVLLKEIDALLSDIEREAGMEVGRTKLLPLIETAAGIEFAFDSASASKRVVALALGGEDLAVDLGCTRTQEGRELLYSRQRLIIAARAAGIEAIDTPFTDAHDEAGLLEDALLAKSLGFSGKLAISPHHLKGIHQAFTPTREEVNYALEVIAAMAEGLKSGAGAVSLRGKMIDKPVVEQAEKTVAIARASGLLDGSEESAGC
ncbi:MAG: CoA ester lyase [Eubacteriales bacterium]|nr:CoA ester lyase [Eubacteriales bacterium]MDD4324695.1 CoA ester lyase [Eubacteriales bacterium]